MIFTLEALHAHKGDSLLLHYGDPARPRLVVIDGGPDDTWVRAGGGVPGLRGRLEALRASRAPDGRLPVRLVMVSHVDDDHINGILEMTDALRAPSEAARPPVEITAFWHNAFDDVIGSAGTASVATVASVQDGSTDQAAEEAARRLPDEMHQAKLVLQSIGQGRRLRNQVAALGLAGNAPFGGLVCAESDENPVSIGAGLTFTVVGPAKKQADELQRAWDRDLKKAKAEKASTQEMEAIAAAYLDRSAANLASIVVLAELEGKRMLLTGDARGDYVLEQMEAQGLIEPEGRIHVDLLKLPHHGSIRNVDRDFFERITADHYVISADGEHHNPDRACLALLTDVRGDAEYTIHLTNPVPHAVEFFEEDQPNRSYRVVYRAADRPSVVVDLGEPLAD